MPTIIQGGIHARSITLCSNGLHRTGSRSRPFRCHHVLGPSPHAAHLQCRRRGRLGGRLYRRRIWRMGIDLSGPGNTCGLPRPAVLPSNWHCVANACGLGLAPSTYRPSDLAIRANLLPWLHDLRLADRRLVPGRRAVHNASKKYGNRRVRRRSLYTP